MNYKDALKYLDSFINFEKDSSYEYPQALKLDRMQALAKDLGNPQNAYTSVLIAGSKGKGSTAAILSSILRMENLRVGLYTSPHLVDVRERIQVNGLLINEIRFAEILTRLQKVLDSYPWKNDPPTYFEMLTAMAFYYFKEMKIQVAVLEVGLGGLYDSTNIVSAKVVGIAPIGLEHTDKLGKTLSKIAVQKCGIIKGRETVVSASQNKEVESVIEHSAREREARLLRVGREIRVSERIFGENFQRFDVKTPFGDFYDLEISLLGEYQLENAALATTMAKALEEKTRLKISESAIRQGIRDARWPGRLEVISKDPLIVLDGAHTPESIQKMLEALKRHFQFEKLIVVLGLSIDKDCPIILEKILSFGATVVATQAKSPRALPARELAQSAKDPQIILVEEDSEQALQKAKSLAGSQDLILVTGSLFLVGDIKIAEGI